MSARILKLGKSVPRAIVRPLKRQWRAGFRTNSSVPIRRGRRKFEKELSLVRETDGRTAGGYQLPLPRHAG